MKERPELTPWELAAIRAQEYPMVIDDNGLPWYVNTIRRLEEEVERLRKALKERVRE